MKKLQGLIFRLEKHHKRKIDLSLDRTYNLLKKLGNPQDKLKNVVNVVGTNAKASMAYSLKSILNKAGYKCNLYTSPHLQYFTERFIINDVEIKEEELIKVLKEVEKVLGNDNASLFEILTCAFLKYAENKRESILKNGRGRNLPKQLYDNLELDKNSEISNKNVGKFKILF